MHLVLSSFFVAGLTLSSALSIYPRGDSRKRAAYILSNQPEGNSLLALSILTANGTVSKPVLTPTGGNGLLGNTANGTAGPDELFGQGAVIVSKDVSITRNYLCLLSGVKHSIMRFLTSVSTCSRSTQEAIRCLCSELTLGHPHISS